MILETMNLPKGQLMNLKPSTVDNLRRAIENGEGNAISMTRTRLSDGKPTMVLNGKAKNSTLGEFEIKNPNEIANSRYGDGSGIQGNLDMLTSKVIKSIERLIPVDYELDKIVDTMVGIEPYMEKTKYEFMGTSTATSADLEISANYNGALHTFTRENIFAESERRFFGFSINTTYIQNQQASVSFARYDQWERKISQVMKEVARIKQELKAFGINKKGERQGGLFNFQGLTIDTSTITKPINEMTTTEINALSKSLIKSWQESTDFIGGDYLPTHFLMPISDRQLINAQRDEQNTAGILNYFDILNKTLSDASGNAINFVGSSLAQKEHNAKYGYNKDFYALTNKAGAGLFQDVPVDMQAILQPAQHGLSFEMLFIFQVGEVFAERPELAKIFTAN